MGVRITVTGSCMEPHVLLEIWLFSDPVRLTTVTVANDGTYHAEVTIPQVPAGTHHIVVLGTRANAQFRSETPLTVTALAPAPVHTSLLARTGINLLRLLFLGLGLFSIGASIRSRRGGRLDH